MNRMTGAWVAAAAVTLIVLVGTGCENGGSSSNPLDATGLTASESAGEGIGMGPLAGITIDDLDKRLSLTDEQTAKMSQTLSRFQAERAEGRADGRGRRGGPGGRLGRGGPAEPPMVGFLEDASQILSPDQFKGLALLIGEKRDQANAKRRGAGLGGPRHEGSLGGLEGFGERAVKFLDLSDEQLSAIRPILETRGKEARGIREQVEAGGLTREQARDRMRANHEETREQIHAILTPEQIEKAESFRRERIEDRVEERMEKLDEQLDRRASFLDRVLGLSDEQAARVREIILATADERIAILEQVKAGTIEPPQVGDAIREVETSLAAQIEALLDEAQRARWEAVKDLLPGRGPRP